VEAGVKLAINTDAHAAGDLDHLRYGVLTARRAGATAGEVVNAMSRTDLAKWIAGTRR
jgi:DNA polymerase (family 10)